MKKILTFLVMLVACVSILSAQDTQIPQAKFNYQAVVRDRNNQDNLVMYQPVTVIIEILQGNADATTADGAAAYTETRTVTTNRNGMVSFVIGSVEGDGNLNEIDWSNALIRATFTDAEGETLSVVENPVMPVPYALSANVDPLEITTKAICDYIATAQASSVDSIFDAMLANTAMSNELKARIVAYAKTESDLAKELAIFFLGTVNPDDIDAAIDTLDEAVKTKIKDLVVAYLKTDDGKTRIYDVLEYYLTNTSKDDVKALWAAARANENFHEIFNAVRDSVIDYIKAHKELVKNVAMYYMTVINEQDVKDLHNYLKTQNQPVYNYMIGKLGDYLNSYLTNEYMAVKECDGKDICDLQAEIDQLKQDALQCPKVSAASIDGMIFTATVANVNNFSAETANSYLLIYKDDTTGDYYLPQTGSLWQSSTVANTFSITDAENPVAGDYYFKLEMPNRPQGCVPSVVKVTVGVTPNGN